MFRKTNLQTGQRKTFSVALKHRHRVLSLPARFTAGIVLLFLQPDAQSLLAREPDKRVRTIYHEDGRKTLSEKDNTTGVLEEYTYDERNTLLLRKQFQIDNKGRARRGQIFDARQNLLARIEYGFDNLGRVEEERMFDARGNVIRRLLYRYDAQGKRLRPVAYTFDPDGNSSRRIDPENLPPTIMTPDINGARELPGNRYEDGDLREVPGINTRPLRR
jgi:hypothetical protein